ncbi:MULTISPECIES: hypothetical protein [Bradyrhizobium]|jgi:hypothetical protein|uniref:hypothetical protein n=1 Tax=Bradyrhizobium TaxID=374 RepID=UPI00041AD6E2|nr:MULTISPECIES: hypothetical protein [Bradyrhizobium]QOG18011.1 hypothetical protein FOM02_12310 [Bradyrhizobium sp. SEMIA]UFW52040.1 hypothetical protein BaraCB756_14100 [Bradyrhizobium arachidis]
MFTRLQTQLLEAADRSAEKQQTETRWTNVKDRRDITLNCNGAQEFNERSLQAGLIVGVLMATPTVSRGA